MRDLRIEIRGVELAPRWKKNEVWECEEKNYQSENMSRY